MRSYKADIQALDKIANALSYPFVKRLKKALLGIIALLLLLLIVGFFLPGSARVQRKTTIHANSQTVFEEIATLRSWPDWTAWTTNRFLDMQLSFEGEKTGVGAIMIAEGKSSGDGMVRITKADAMYGIEYELNFEHGTQIFHGAITFQPTNGALNVVWTLDAPLGSNPVKRWGGLLLDRLMGNDMATGLANLKRQSEAAGNEKGK